MRVVGAQDINNSAHAFVMAALIRAYDDPNAVIYAEPMITGQTVAPDIVLIHPEIGVLVVEVKAYEVGYIRRAEAGTLTIWRDGAEQQVSPYRQAQRYVYAIRDAAAPQLRDAPTPLYVALVALPNINTAAWQAARYSTGLDPDVVLFSDVLADDLLLKQRITTHIQQRQKLALTDTPLPETSRAAVFGVFGQGDVLSKPRVTRQLPYKNIGAEIDRLEAAHKTLSVEQQELARLDTWGYPYLVRGVAGSGKSVVLAYQVAWTILRHQQQHQQLTLFPEDRHQMPKIVVVCLVRALVPFLKRSIETAYRQISGQKALPEGVLTVTHLNGLVFDLTQTHDNFHYLPMPKKGSEKDAGARARGYVEQLETLTRDELDAMRFDAIYLDEGQDIHPDMLQLLLMLVRPNVKTEARTINIFYDDAQNIFGNPRPVWQQMGLNLSGRAHFMQRCYRNSAEIVELGFNVLLGEAADDKVTAKARRFADVQTLLEKDLLKHTVHGWRVSFAEKQEQIPQVMVFNHRAEQIEWVRDVLLTLLKEEKVRPEDILVLSPYGRSFDRLRQLLMAEDASLVVRRVGGKTPSELEEGVLKTGTLSMATISTAKGYDAPITILMDTDELATTMRGRAQFYVGVTRAKRYLIVTGVKSAGTLLSEAAILHKRLFS